MSEGFRFDVFLSHSTKDKPVVREVAVRLKKDGIRVWMDEEQIKPGDSIPAKIEEGLENSRVLVLCMSAHAFGSEWAQLEAGTFRFRDPLNKERRFIPLRLDNSPIRGTLAQFLYIDWQQAGSVDEYAKLVEACREPEMWPVSDNPLSAFLTEPTKRQDDDLISIFAKAKPEELLAYCNQIIQCFAGFDTVVLTSPQLAAEQAKQIDHDWLQGFNRAHEILCLAATARRVDFEVYKELANSSYGFWQGLVPLKKVEADLKKLFSPSISALHNLKRILMVEIADTQSGSPIKPSGRSQSNDRAQLTRLEINKLVNRYIGVNGGYLGDFTYRSHHDFYLDLDLDIDPYNYDGTTRERFIKILSDSPPHVQLRILEGVLERFPVGSGELRTKQRYDEIAGWIARLKG